MQADTPTSSVQVIDDGTIYTDVIMEMLYHQGISCRKVTEAKGSDYVCIVPTETERAKEAVVGLKRDRTLVAEDAFDLKRVLLFFQGKERSSEDVLEPFVNFQEEGLVKELNSICGERIMQRDFWPGGAHACCVLTHDIDWVSYSPFHRVVLSRVGVLKGAALALKSITGQEYGWNIDKIIDMERSMGYRSTFMFMERYKNDSLQRNGICVVGESGFEVSLHGSDGAHISAERMKSQLERIEKISGRKVKGVRHHILKFSVPLSWEIAEKSGLEYDATFYYNKLFGFRAGICYPYRPFGEETRYSLLELPTSFMDFTALYRKMDVETMWHTMRKLMERVERFNGSLVVNFHNTYLNKDTFPDIHSFYSEFLDELRKRRYWVATAEECVQWWRKRTYEAKT